MCRKVGGKGILEAGARGRWFHMQSGRTLTFVNKVSQFLGMGSYTLYANISWDWQATPLPPNSPHPEDLGEEYLSLQCWKMTSLLKCMNFYLQRTSCFHPKEVLCKGPEQGLQCMRLSNILPTAPTSSSWPVISCLLHLSESCNLSKTLGRNWLPLWMGQWPLQLIGISAYTAF